MKNFNYTSKNILPVLLFFLLLNSQNFAQEQNLVGTWLGTLKFSGTELRVVFNVQEDNGLLKATMDSPDQNAKGIPVDSVIFENSNVRFNIKAVGGYYDGVLNKDNMEIQGNWHQGGVLPLDLKKTDKVESLNRPQEPKPPYPYKEENVTYENKNAGINLAGTLTLPENGEHFPAVLLIPGSGSHNRDEEISGHKIFKVIADYLTRRGIAVLRVDDRGVGSSTGNFGTSSDIDFASDAYAGVEYLKSRMEINPAEIGLIGHSEGGIIAPMVALKTKDVAFIVLMAAPGIPGDQLLYKQAALIGKSEGATDEEIQQDLKLNKILYTIVQKVKDSTQAAEEIHKAFSDYYNGLSEENKKQIQDPEGFFARQSDVLLSPWFKFLISYNPAQALEELKCPVFAIDGSKDLQVPPKEDLDAIKAALKKGMNKNFEVKELPGLNHLFQTAKTGSPAEYGKIEETISPVALQTIGDWIIKITKGK
ncbi:MAG: alpha/beta hydrolase family protein [Ignavibacteriaceae bacterium]